MHADTEKRSIMEPLEGKNCQFDDLCVVVFLPLVSDGSTCPVRSEKGHWSCQNLPTARQFTYFRVTFSHFALALPCG